MSRFTQLEIAEVYEQETDFRLRPHLVRREIERSSVILRMRIVDIIPPKTLAEIYRIAYPEVMQVSTM